MSNLYCLPGRAGGSPGYASSSARLGDFWVTQAAQEEVIGQDITSKGYLTGHFANGDVAYLSYEGTAKVTPKELGDAIQLEAEHHIPFAIDDVFLDYQVVSQSANAMSVVLVATKKVKVLEYVAAVEAAGLDAVIVDLDAFAMQNQFELGTPEEGADAVALIDIGASVMKTNVIHGGACIFAGGSRTGIFRGDGGCARGRAERGQCRTVEGGAAYRRAC